MRDLVDPDGDGGRVVGRRQRPGVGQAGDAGAAAGGVVVFLVVTVGRVVGVGGCGRTRWRRGGGGEVWCPTVSKSSESSVVGLGRLGSAKVGGEARLRIDCKKKG